MIKLATVLVEACREDLNLSEKFVPGKYVGKAKGMSGIVSVHLDVNEHEITAVNIDAKCESMTFGQAAAKYFEKQILKQQTPEVDAFSGASATSQAVKSAANDALAEARN